MDPFHEKRARQEVSVGRVGQGSARDCPTQEAILTRLAIASHDPHGLWCDAAGCWQARVAVPEKFNVATLVEGPPSIELRLSFLDQAAGHFHPWLKQPREVMLLDFKRSAPGQTRAWSEADQLIRRSVSPTELLFVYYETVDGTGGSTVVSIAEAASKSDFTIALADMSVAGQPRDVGRRMCGLMRWAASANRKCMVIAGGEVEIGDAWNDVRSGILAASSDLIVTLLCCHKADLPGSLPGFETLQEEGSAILLQRRA
jgi:hypothetical protein